MAGEKGLPADKVIFNKTGDFARTVWAVVYVAGRLFCELQCVGAIAYTDYSQTGRRASTSWPKFGQVSSGPCTLLGCTRPPYLLASQDKVSTGEAESGVSIYMQESSSLIVWVSLGFDCIRKCAWYVEAEFTIQLLPVMMENLSKSRQYYLTCLCVSPMLRPPGLAGYFLDRSGQEFDYKTKNSKKIVNVVALDATATVLL